jgi:hypothetical protein
MHLFTFESIHARMVEPSQCMPNGGTWVNACLNGGGLLQDNVSPIGDMVHCFVDVFASFYTCGWLFFKHVSM